MFTLEAYDESQEPHAQRVFARILPERPTQKQVDAFMPYVTEGCVLRLLDYSKPPIYVKTVSVRKHIGKDTDGNDIFNDVDTDIYGPVIQVGNEIELAEEV